MTEIQFIHIRNLSNRLDDNVWMVLMEFLEDPNIIPVRGFFLDKFLYRDKRLYFVQHK